jgi:hypothetical protein
MKLEMLVVWEPSFGIHGLFYIIKYSQRKMNYFGQKLISFHATFEAKK